MKAVPLRPITPAAFAPYGWVAQGDGPADGRSARPINGGNSLRVDGVGALALTAEGGAPCLALFRAQGRPPQGPWHTLERHRLGSQTFVPLGGVPYVVLVALGEPEAPAPRPDTLAAFLVNGQQAVTLRAGTWHHALIALHDGDFVVIERQAATVDCDLATLAQPVTLSVPNQAAG